jgi:hypothetical protein
VDGEGADPYPIDISQRDQVHAEMSGSQNSITAIYVDVYGDVRADIGDHAGPPWLKTAAWLDGDDRLAHPSPPRARFLHGAAKPFFAPVTYQVCHTRRQNRGTDRSRS